MDTTKADEDEDDEIVKKQRWKSVKT